MKAGRPVKRSLTIAGHRTSISLERAFWDALKAAGISMPFPQREIRIIGGEPPARASGPKPRKA